MARNRKAPEQAPAQTQPVEVHPSTALVPMVRDGKTADVHPDEVSNWARHGWERMTDGPDR